MSDTASERRLATELRGIEELAVELTDIAGAEITRRLGTILSVRYKSGTADDAERIKWRDPVSEVDQRIESIVRRKLAEHFPDHGIIGEEMVERPSRDHEFVWAIDPIDGTTNFVNGFPIFSASIGVLHRGRPIVGALWCSISHALRAGTYHASRGGKLRFDGADVTPKINPHVRRRLAGVSNVTGEEALWDTRKTGSAAIECALVAAGLMQVARFAFVNIWDIAGGIALVEAANGVVRQSIDGKSWTLMDRFEPATGSNGDADLRHWRRSIIVGRTEDVARMSGL